MSLSLEYELRPPSIKIDNPPLIILLHGYGSNENDLFSFAPELPPEFLVLSVRAPLTLVMGSYAWYSIHFDASDGKFSDTEEAIVARDLIAVFIEEIRSTLTFDHEKVYLMGFSQGTILSYAVAMTYPHLVKNIIALSGYINLDLVPKAPKKEDYQHLDFYISHGSVDQVLPVEWGRQAPPYLKALDIKHQYEEYPVGHGVAPQNFYSFKAWMEKRM